MTIKPTYEELQAQTEALRKALNDQLNDCINFDGGKLTDAIMKHSSDLLAATPQQHLAEIRAEAGELGYYNGFKDAIVIEPPLPPANGTYATVDIFSYRVEQLSRYAANQYADSIRQEKK